jgi:hypothetical protein
MKVLIGLAVIVLVLATSGCVTEPSANVCGDGFCEEGCLEDCKIKEKDRFGLHATWDRTGEMRELGTNLVRGLYDFKSEEDLRKWLVIVQEPGIHFVITILPMGEWGNPVVNSLDIQIPGDFAGFPGDVEAYKKDLRKFVEGIDGDGVDDYPELMFPIKFVSVDNEPFWMWLGDPPDDLKTMKEVYQWRLDNLEEVYKSYGEFLKITYETIKEASPEMVVLMGDVFDPNVGINELEKMVVEEYSDYCDGYDIHYYGNYSAFESKLKEWDFVKERGKPIWFLELGGPMQEDPFDTPEEIKRFSEEVVKMQVLVFEWGAEKAFWSSLIETPAWPQSFLNTALLTRSLSKKPAFYTQKLLVSKINHFDSVSRIKYGFKFEFPDKDPVFVLWSGQEETIDFSAFTSSQNVLVTHIITEQGQSEPETQAASASFMVVSETPIFVEGI